LFVVGLVNFLVPPSIAPSGLNISQREEPYSAFSSLWSSELYKNSSTTDEDDKDDTIVFFAAVAAAMHNQEQRRLVPHDQQHFLNRVVWERHVEELDHQEDAFRTMYWMHHTSFLKLCALIDPFLMVNPAMSRLWTAGKAQKHQSQRKSLCIVC
jgi:hypothetical protein